MIYIKLQQRNNGVKGVNMKKRSSFAVLFVVAVISLVLVPSVAHAGGSSRFYNNYGSTVTVYPCINFNTYSSGSLRCSGATSYPDNYRFTMTCWRDALISYSGNYSSKRWFFGDVWTSSGSYKVKPRVWVHSSHVYNQTWVPRCG